MKQQTPRSRARSTRYFKIVVASLVAMLIGSGAAPLSVASAASYQCGSNFGNKFDGFYHVQQGSYSFEGASTYIVARTSTLCATDTNPNNWSYAWEMAAANDGNGWAQAGPSSTWVNGAVKIRYMAQTARTRTDYRTVITSATGAGERHTYRTLWYPGCSCELSTIDGAEIQRSWFNPYSYWSTPFDPQFFGEVNYFETDMPGKGSVHTNFTGLGAENTNDDTLVAMPCTMNGRVDSAAWGLTGLGCSNFDLWTK